MRIRICVLKSVKTPAKVLSRLHYVLNEYIRSSPSQTSRFVSSSSIHHLKEGFSQRSAPRCHASSSTLGFYLFPWLQILSPVRQLPHFCFYPNKSFKNTISKNAVILSIKRTQSRITTVYIMNSTVVFNMNSEIDQAPMKF